MTHLVRPALFEKTKRRVFLSFAHEDRQRVQGLRLLKDNPKFELDFYDESVQVAINSQRADYIKQTIRDKIRRCSVTVCLIGETTHQSRWVEWELDTCEKLDKKVIVMALKSIDRATLPRFVKDRQLNFWSWNPEHLGRLIEGA